MATQFTGYQGLLGWTVGRFDWLNAADSKVSRYWRVIEHGSAATKWPWMGKTIVGLWGPRAGPRGQLRGSGDSIFAEGVGNQKFIPFFTKMDADLEQAKKAALMTLFGVPRGGRLKPTRNEDLLWGKTPSDKARALYNLVVRVPVDRVPFVQGTISNEIEPRNFYGKTLASFRPLEVELAALREEVGPMIGGLDPNSNQGRARSRELVAFDAGTKPRSGRRKVEGIPTTGRVTKAGKTVGTGLVTVGASALVQDFIRDGGGHFTSGAWQDMIRSVNARVAEAFQEALVAEMRAERTRPATGALVDATKDPRNRYPQ